MTDLDSDGAEWVSACSCSGGSSLSPSCCWSGHSVPQARGRATPAGAASRRSTFSASAMPGARSTRTSSSRSDATFQRARRMTADRQRRRLLGIAGASVVAGTLPFVPWSRRAAAATTDNFTPDVEIELVARPDEVQVLAGRPTAVWRYVGRVLKGPADTLQPIADSYVGPILRFRTGQKVRIRYQNRIPQPSIVHWHGLLVPERMDGHPRDVVRTGGDYVYEF